jgi:beta-phosphoglucomutase
MNIFEHGNNVFLMLDLDGTIIDTDYMHYEGYRDVLLEYSVTLTWKEFEEAINVTSIETLIKSYNLQDEYKNIKQQKLQNMLQYTNIKYIDGAEEFLNKLIDNNINFVIVTNTSRLLVEHFKKCAPLLNKITNWITREDYNEPKPNSESYKVSISKYYKNEEHIIGFENTINGYNAIKNICNIKYFITTEDSFSNNLISKEDNVFLIKNYKIEEFK